MKTSLEFKSLFVYSSKSEKSALYTFDKLNIIYGRNTSGKSSVLKSIIYTLGVNDGKEHLAEVFQEEPVFRLDCVLNSNSTNIPLIFIRDIETLYIKYGDEPVVTFHGISGNNSFEHVKLKTYLSSLFAFKLQLENKNEYKAAPIEAMLLPYYVPQSVGWVYLYKSFAGLEFYRNFKEDYLDYYLGIENFDDRIEKHRLEKEKANLQNEVTFYSNMQSKDSNLEVTKLVDEEFGETAKKYIEGFALKKSKLLELENEYVTECNKLTYFKQRKTILTKVSNHHKTQRPEVDNCPACFQILPTGLPEAYEFFQDENDTEKELKSFAVSITKIQSHINSLTNKINESRNFIQANYETLKKATSHNISWESWMTNKANVKLITNIDSKIGQLAVEIERLKERIKIYKTDDEIISERNSKSNLFWDIFSKNLKALKVKDLGEDRYTKLYNISAFPYQGVELLKTIMAFHFAFNKLISATENVHRLPFVLDAIFKEDLELESKETILDFISKNIPTDTQIFITVSQSSSQNVVPDYNQKFFESKGKLISVGNGTEQRSLMKPHISEYDSYIQDTVSIINSGN